MLALRKCDFVVDGMLPHAVLRAAAGRAAAPQDELLVGLKGRGDVRLARDLRAQVGVLLLQRGDVVQQGPAPLRLGLRRGGRLARRVQLALRRGNLVPAAQRSC